MLGGDYSLPVLIDLTVLTSGQVRAFNVYGISSIPATFFIDSQGIIRNIKLGTFSMNGSPAGTLSLGRTLRASIWIPLLPLALLFSIILASVTTANNRIVRIVMIIIFFIDTPQYY